MSKLPPWLLTIMAIALILWLTLAEKPLGDTSITLFDGADKLVHGIIFAGLTLAMLLDYTRTRGWQRTSWRILVAAPLTATAIGIAIEVIQPDMGRSFEWADMLGDAAGSFTTAAIWAMIERWKATK